MTSPELLSLVPLLLASLVPASLVIGAFLVSRERSRFLMVPTFVTTLTACLAVLARFQLSMSPFLRIGIRRTTCA